MGNNSHLHANQGVSNIDKRGERGMTNKKHNRTKWVFHRRRNFLTNYAA
jgi:hypothetical protein